MPAAGAPIFEETGQHQALRPGGFHHHAVAQQRGVDDEVVEDGAQVRRRRQVGRRRCGHLRVVGQYARVVEELVPVDVGAGDVLQAQEKEVQGLALVGSQQLAQWTHGSVYRELSSRPPTPDRAASFI